MSSSFGHCTICTFPFECGSNSMSVLVKCGHTYHFECIERWIRSSKTCPKCRNKTTLGDIQRCFVDDGDELESPSPKPKGSPFMEEMRPKFESARQIPIRHQIECGLHLSLINALTMPDISVQLEAISAISRFFAGEQIWAIVQTKGVKKLLELCKTESEKVAKQAFLAIANIPLKKSGNRKMLFAEGIVQILVELANRIDSMDRSFVWPICMLIYNFTLECPFHEMEMLSSFIPPLSILLKYNDSESRNCACWALFHLIQTSKCNTKMAHQQGCVPAVIGLLKSGRPELAHPALHVLEKFAAFNEESVQSIIESGILQNSIHRLMGSNDDFVKLKCGQIVFEFFSRKNRRQIQAIIDAKLMHFIFDILERGGQMGCWEAMENLVQNCAPQQIVEICQTENCISAICKNLEGKKGKGKMLEMDGDGQIGKIMETLYAFLDAVSIYASENLVAACERVEACGGLEKLKELQRYKCEKIRNWAEKIVDKFFSNELKKINKQ